MIQLSLLRSAILPHVLRNVLRSRRCETPAVRECREAIRRANRGC